MTSLSALFYSNSIFKKMRCDGYKIQHINTNQAVGFNVFDWNFKDDEFFLGAIWSDLGFYFHVCCFGTGIIVDSNQTHVVDLTIHDLEKVCDLKYARIHSGLYFHRRPDQPLFKYKSRKQKGEIYHHKKSYYDVYYAFVLFFHLNIIKSNIILRLNFLVIRISHVIYIFLMFVYININIR